MNVKQALKVKNKLVTDLKTQYQILQKYNSIEEGNTRRYSMTNALAKIKTLQAELVGLKTQIHRANSPVYDKIFALAELKGMIKELKKVPTDEGKSSDRYSSIPSVKEVELNVTDIDNSISILETQIEELQNELDVHNATTNI
jgi:predicted  nucleic acid-binding Zn-ribbon protein